MKKTATFLTLILFFAVTAFAGPVDPDKALEIANTFWTNNSLSGKKAVTLQLAPDNAMSKSGSRLSIEESDAQYYLITPQEGNGFVIVSGEDRLSPIVGYSTGSTAGEMPQALVDWLAEYSSYVDDIRAGNIEPAITTGATGPAIAPMLKTSWNQSAPYNNLCPTINGQKTPTGCTATAMAQVMKYHNWPEKPIKAITWNNSATGKQETVDITKNTYDWDNMLPHYRNGYNSTQAHAVAQLMFDVGRAINSTYAPAGTGSADIYASRALVNVFDYSPQIKLLRRSECTYEEFFTAIRDNLEAGLPVLHYGHGQSYAAGHAFVCDGIDANNLVHIDWGWDGAYNGYFDIGSMAPGGSGIGGGQDRYNVGQTIMINIKPRTADEADRQGDPTLYIFDPVNPATNASLDEYTARFSAGNAKVRMVGYFLNWSHSTYNIQYMISVTSADGQYNRMLLGNSDVEVQFEKATGYYIDLNVNNSNKNNPNYLSEGTYYIEIYYKDADGNNAKMKGEPNCLKLEVGATNVKLSRALPEIELTDFKFRETPVYPNDNMVFDIALRNNNANNATVVVVPIVNKLNGETVVNSDTLSNHGILINVFDNTDFLATYTVPNGITGSGDHYISFAYDIRNCYVNHEVKVENKKLKSIAGKSATFTIQEIPEGPIPTVASISTPEIVVGRKLTVTANVKNAAFTDSPYAGTLGLFAEKDGKSILLAEKEVANLARNASTSVSFSSEDYFPALTVGTYNTYVCELVGDTWKKISGNGAYSFTLNEATTGVPYVCEKIVVGNDNTAVKGDSVDMKTTLGCEYADFEGYVRVNVLNGITMVLRSDYIPVSMTQGNTLEMSIRCMCGKTAPLGQRVVSIAYYDNNKRQLGHVSNNSVNIPDNGLFLVTDGTGIESIADSGITLNGVNGCISIEGAAEGAVISVFGVDGTTVYNGTATAIAVEAGLYIVTVEQEGKLRAAKVLVK